MEHTASQDTKISPTAPFSVEKGQEKLPVLIFDADDTLWDCQSHFDQVEHAMALMLAPWCSEQEAHAELIRTETNNIGLSGFGAMPFILSVIETAIRVSKQQIPATQIEKLIQMGYGLLQMPATPLPMVEETLSLLTNHRKMVFTKGDQLDQRRKLKRSGLERYFDAVEVTTDKTPEGYRRLLEYYDIAPEQAIMIGNSFKSDIAPALAIGMKAIYIPFHIAWQLEHSDEFEHQNLERIERFAQIPQAIAQLAKV